MVILSLRSMLVQEESVPRNRPEGKGKTYKSHTAKPVSYTHLMEIQVVGGIDRLVRVGDGAGVIRQTIEQGRVDLEQPCGLAGLLQTVIDDGGDIPLIRTVRLLFNEGGDDDHILDVYKRQL